METELQDKHHAKRKMKIAIRKFQFQLRRTVNNMTFKAIMYQLNIAIKSQTKQKKPSAMRSYFRYVKRKVQGWTIKQTLDTQKILYENY